MLQELFCILSHKGSENHSAESLRSQNSGTALKAGKDMEKQYHSYPAGTNVNVSEF